MSYENNNYISEVDGGFKSTPAQGWTNRPGYFCRNFGLILGHMLAI